jgi:hypothetical protein
MRTTLLSCTLVHVLFASRVFPVSSSRNMAVKCRLHRRSREHVPTNIPNRLTYRRPEGCVHALRLFSISF